jgi:hypothetical protein
MSDTLVVSLTIESSDAESTAQGTRSLQEFLNRAELGISTSREAAGSAPGYKGFELGALSVIFNKSVLTPLAEILKAFGVRNRNLTLKFPSPNGQVVITGENVSVDQLVQLLDAAARFGANRA